MAEVQQVCAGAKGPRILPVRAGVGAGGAWVETAVRRKSSVRAPRSRIRRFVAVADVVGVLTTMVLCVLLERWAGRAVADIGWGSGFLYLCAATAAVWLLSLLLADSRDVNLLLAGPDYYARVIRATFSAFGLVAVASLAGGVETARSVVAFGFPIGVVLVVLARWLVRNSLLKRVGSEAGSWLRHRVLSVVAEPGPGSDSALISAGYRLFEPVGTVAARSTDEVLKAAREHGASLVFVSRDALLGPRQLQILGWELDGAGIAMCVEPSASTIRPGRTLLLPHPTTTLLLVRTVHLSIRDRFIKRTADVIVTVILIPLLLPVVLIAGIAVVVEDGFPMFFRQHRLGRGGRLIRIYKLRTMYRDADSKRPQPRSRKAQHDPRCTSVGRFLRRWSIDEIPQLWCVLAGTMSLVGPRPRLESELAGSPEEFRRLEARPGLTGLWQTSGRSDLSFEEAEQLDVEYVDNWSLIGDLVILARTLRTVVGGRGAY